MERQEETSPGVPQGQLWSSGRWRLCLSATPNHQTPKPIKHQTELLLSLSLVLCTMRVKFGQYFRVFSAHKTGQVLQAVPVLFSKSDPKTLNEGHQKSSLFFGVLGPVFHFLQSRMNFIFTHPVVVSESLVTLMS